MIKWERLADNIARIGEVMNSYIQVFVENYKEKSYLEDPVVD
jgi:hypothetical protein